MTTLDPAVRELLAAIRATLFEPYRRGAMAGDAIATARGTIAAVLAGEAPPGVAAAVLVESTAEEADAGRVRFADRLGL